MSKPSPDSPPRPGPTQPGFWDHRYAANRMPWDAGGSPAALVRWLKVHPGGGAHALIPGCGSGHEIAAFAAQGYRVTAIDFSAEAVSQAKAKVSPDLAAGIITGDFFTHPLPAGKFDVIYERTFFCALPPTEWPRIAGRCHDLLRPRGLLIGIFFFGPKDDGPPFGFAPGEADLVLGNTFSRTADTPIPPHESLPIFAGGESWMEWRRT